MRPFGRSLGLEIPEDMLARLDLKAGDSLLLSQAEDGSLVVTRAEPAQAEQMRVAREGMRNYRDALRELAK